MGRLALRRVAAARTVGAVDVGRALHGRARRVSGEACGVLFQNRASGFVDEPPGYKTCVRDRPPLGALRFLSFSSRASGPATCLFILYAVVAVRCTPQPRLTYRPRAVCTPRLIQKTKYSADCLTRAAVSLASPLRGS